MRFLVVKGSRYSEDVLDRILQTFRQHLGEGMNIRVEFVDDIALVRTGKHMATISKLDVDFQQEGSPLRQVAT